MNPKANGAVMASLLAAGIGCTTLGILVVAVEASPHFFKTHLNFFDPVGPLSGVSLVAVAVYLASWAALSVRLSGREVNEKKYLAWTLALVAFGFVFTFPPIYQLFTVAG